MTAPLNETPVDRDARFGDRLAAAVAARESQIVLGIDPDPLRLWPDAVDRASEARAALAHAMAEAERTAARVTAVTAGAEPAGSEGGAVAPDRPAAAGPVPVAGVDPVHAAAANNAPAAAADPAPAAAANSAPAAAADPVPAAAADPVHAAAANPGPAAGGSPAFVAGLDGPPAAESAARAIVAGARLEAAAAVLAHSLALVDAAGPACVAVKPQLAFFEQFGFAGWLALDAVCAHARARGLLVLADGKRGDVPSTAVAYARALTGTTSTPFGRAAGLEADAFTANPLLGRDALTPLVDGARAASAGVFVLVRTSNPGAADLFDLPLASGEPLWERLAALVAAVGQTGASGLSDVGAVTGATAPQHLERMRALMPAAPFLLPGVGAQGGDVRALAAAFAPGRAAGLVTASRSIANAHEQAATTPAHAAQAEAERLRAAAWGLV